MKKLVLAAAALATASVAISQPAYAAPGVNDIGPSVSFGDGQSTFGIDGRFGISNGISLRPFVAFPSGGGTNYGGSLTYDFDINGPRRTRNPVTPYLGVGVSADSFQGRTETTGYGTAGVDFAASRDIALKGSVSVPFDNRFTTSVTVGVGYRF
jgi:opacity protein-like surface antigen